MKWLRVFKDFVVQKFFCCSFTIIKDNISVIWNRCRLYINPEHKEKPTIDIEKSQHYNFSIKSDINEAKDVQGIIYTSDKVKSTKSVIIKLIKMMIMIIVIFLMLPLIFIALLISLPFSLFRKITSLKNKLYAIPKNVYLFELDFWARVKIWINSRKLLLLSVKLFCIVLAAMVSAMGLWDLALWSWNKRHMEKISRHYADVAHEMYYKENNIDSALWFINKAVELNGDDPEYRIQKAYISNMEAIRKLLNLDRPMTQDELNFAHRSLAEAKFLQKTYPDKVEAFILEAQVLTTLQEYDKAEVLLHQAIKMAPDNSFSYVRLGMLLFYKMKYNKAIKNFKYALEINPKSKWAYVWSGIVLSKQQKWDQAERFYRKALELDPKFDLAWYNLGQIYLSKKQKDYILAKKCFEKAIKYKPNCKEAYYGLGMSYGHQDKYRLAVIYFDKAIKLDKRFLTAYEYRGVTYGEMKHYKDAIKDFNSAIELDPQNTQLRTRRAKAFCKINRFDDAVADLTFAQEMEPDNKRIYLYFGNVYSDVNNKEKAIFNYNKALKIDPRYGEAMAQLAELYFKCNNTEKALELFHKAESSTKYKAERFTIRMGDIHMGKKNFIEAQKCYKKVIHMDSKNAKAWLGEAKALFALGRIKDGLKSVNVYMTMRPQDKDAVLLKQKY